jgi:hypothetical protein
VVGTVPESVGVMWQHPVIFRNMMGFGRKVDKWDRLDADLASLATMAAAATVGCSFCLDFGYFTAHHKGLDEGKAREVRRWRESQAFTALERRVMEYAEAVSQTPPAVTDQMSAALLEELGAPALVGADLPGGGAESHRPQQRRVGHPVAGARDGLRSAAACDPLTGRTLIGMNGDPFLAHRSLLFTIAYEVLGSAADAQDVVQETWLRWAGVDQAEVRDPRAFLVRVVTRQALDRLRAVFVLREVFDLPYGELAEAVGKTPAAVRQISHRARTHVAARRPRQAVSPAETRAAFDAFTRAVTTGDLEGLVDDSTTSSTASWRSASSAAASPGSTPCATPRS